MTKQNLDEQVYILENAFFEANKSDEFSKTIISPNWLQLITPSAHHSSLNTVFRSVLSEGELQKQIDEIKKLYRSMNVSFRWLTTPLTQPENTGEKLKENGFEFLYEAEAMIIETEKAITSYSDKIKVRQIGLSEIDLYMDAFQAAWELSDDQKKENRKFFETSLKKHSNFYPFVASYDGQIVAHSVLLSLTAGGCLVGGAVAANYRKKGIYKAMVSERAKLAQKLGEKYLMIHAKKETSAPICRALGFRHVYDYQVYEYTV